MDSNKISRRQALKALLATSGGLTAAAFVPFKWVKPVVMSGVLPVHAQTSGYTFSNPAEAGDATNKRNGHQVTGYFPYIYYDFDASNFGNSSIAATVVGANVAGIDVELDITKKVGATTIGYMVASVPTYTFPISRTTDATGVAHFPMLQVMGTGGSWNLTFTYKRGGTTLFDPNDVFFTYVP